MLPTRATVDDFYLYETDAQLYHWVEDLTSWDMLSFPNLNVPDNGYNAMGLYAMPGDGYTSGFSIEIVDKNGARWYANVSFSDGDWAYYLLYPTDFTWWKDGAQPQSNVPNFDEIVRVQLGFANSYRNNSLGEHSYYCSNLMLYVTDEKLPSQADALVLEGVSPMSELFPITNAKSLAAADNQSYVSSRDYVIPEELFSCAPGRQATGFDKGMTYRFVPLIRVTDEKGLHSGYAAWMHVYYSTAALNGKMEGAIVGTFSGSKDFYNADGIAAVVETVRAMTGDTFIIDGGTTEHIYVESDTTSLSAGVNFVANKSAQITATVALYDGNTLLHTLSSEQTKIETNAKGVSTLRGSYDISGGKPDRAVITLTENGRAVDTITQEISYWSPKPADDRSFIYTEDGYFKKDGEIITFFGVNYMPSYGMAERNGTYFEHYVSDASYDPTTIEYDLAHIQDIGMNAVSIFVYYDYMKNCNNILDLINKCEQRGIYVDLSIRSHAYPLNDASYSYDEVKTLVQRLHFHENDNIIAYDIAWEPRIGSYAASSSYVGRQQWDAQWVQWIEDNYGSISHAEALWGVKIPKNAKGVPVITDEMLDNTSSAYKKTIAAYYRFIDDIVAAELQAAMVDMQALAPDQMFSFRMSMSGSALRSPGYAPSTHCFDFQSLASTMAFMEPEGYALRATDESSLQITFANAYARYVQPDSPVVWKEFGKHCWTGLEDGNFKPDEQLLQLQADYYAYALEYCLNAYTSGMFCWFYAGGFRVGENSDYGILNPDGSDRPVTALLREYAPKFINQGARDESDAVEIVIERDDYVGGLFGMFDAVKNQLSKANENGQYVVFINKTQDSAADYAYADELLDEAIGATKAEGQYPLRYVNGQIMNVEIVSEGGKTVAKITVCNTKQSTWRAGTVSVVSTSDSKVTVDATIDQELSYLEQTTITVPVSGKGAMILRFEIDGQTFGMRYSATVK